MNISLGTGNKIGTITRCSGKEMKNMKAKFSAVIKKTLKNVAVSSSETTSLFALYQPKTPKALVKSEKK